MYNRSGNYASGFWIVLGGVLIGLLLACSMDWSVPDENAFLTHRAAIGIESTE